MPLTKEVIPFPDGILINGRGPNGVSFNIEQEWTEGNGVEPAEKVTTSTKQLHVALFRCTPNHGLFPLDNVGMWNLRSEFWARQYLGQQFYLRIYTNSNSLRDEFPIPKNARLCGRAAGRPL